MQNRIIIATHKKYRMPEDMIYVPVHVGAENKESIGYTRDNTGDNISLKNPYYCELTGLYWAWKNLDADYLGLAHYRRHFSYKKVKSNDKFESVINGEQLDYLCSKYDVLLPKKRNYYIETLYSHYEHTHYVGHLDATRKIIENKYPQYIESYDKAVNRTSGYMFNMFVMKRELFDDYCNWLFSILFELEKNTHIDKSLDVTKLSSFQARFYGRISEIIFNAWLDYQIENKKISKNKIKEIKCIHMEPINWGNKIMSFFKAKFLKKKYDSSF